MVVLGTALLCVQNAPIKSSLPTFISRNLAAPSDNMIDGYLSDVYFVDGHALEPTEFGALFPQDPSEPNRRWGPLDSSDVTANINSFEPTPPIPTTPNQTEDWNSKWTGSTYAGYSINNVHDGSTPDIGTGTVGSNCTLAGDATPGLVFTPDTPIPVTQSVRLRVTSGGDNDSGLPTIIINDGTANSKEWVQIDGAGLQDVEATAAELGGEFINLTLKAQGGGGAKSGHCAAIWIDGRYLQTGGPIPDEIDEWNTSQVWSDNFVLSNPDTSYSDTTKSFDGDLTTRSGSITTPFNGDSQTITHTCSAISCTSLRVHARLNTNSTGTIVAAGQTVNLDPDNTDKWYTFTGSFSDYEGLTATITNTSNMSAGVYIHAIEVNGEILVDGGSFGANGFHLPFNPAAESQSWSSLASGVTTYLSSGPIGNGFDGDKNSTTRWSGSETLTIDLSTFSGSHTITIDPHQTDSGNTAGTNQVIITDANGSRTTTIPVGNQNDGASVITDNVQRFSVSSICQKWRSVFWILLHRD